MNEIPLWEPLSDEVLSDQLGQYDEHRRACPVARSPRGVTVFRHADVVAVATDHETFSSGASAFRSVPNTMDPPEHTRYRPIVNRFFTADRVTALEPMIRRTAHGVILELGTSFDAVTDLGYRFAVRAQVEWLGWEGDEERLVEWMARNHDATRSADRARTAAAAAEFDEIVAGQVARRHAAGDSAPDDPTTELTRIRLDGHPLTDAEIVSILRNWTAGDLASIAASIGVIVRFLTENPDEQIRLRQDPSDLPLAIDEMLRIDDPFLVNRRVATTDAQVAGYDIAHGDRLYLNWTSANRDEAVFGDPDEYRPHENAATNLVWGTGIHICPGRPLATLELVVVTEELLKASTEIRADPWLQPERETYPLGGWRSLPALLRQRTIAD